MKEACFKNDSKQISELQIPMVLGSSTDGEWIYEDPILKDLKESFW